MTVAKTHHQTPCGCRHCCSSRQIMDAASRVQVYLAPDSVHSRTTVSVAKNNSGCPRLSCSRPRRKVVLIPHFQWAEKEGVWVGERDYFAVGESPASSGIKRWRIFQKQDQEAFQFLFTFCHKDGVICISEIIDIASGNLDSSLRFFQSSISHDVLHGKQWLPNHTASSQTPCEQRTV